MSLRDLQLETAQAHERRAPLIRQIEEHFGRPVVVLQTSFHFDNGMIGDDDALMLEEVLIGSKIRKDLLLIINSPGGFGLAAERIVRVCRKYSVNGFDALVPHQAKSAATIVCFGANKIWMGETSELGPIDPQLRIGSRQVSVYNILTSYDQLMRKAAATRGKIEPFLQQLSVYDPRYIAQLKQDMALSETMAIELLKAGMLSGRTLPDIKRCIRPFVDPKQTLEHGRAIFREQVSKCGLQTGVLPIDEKVWPVVWDLHIRYEHVMNSHHAKMVESAKASYSMPGMRHGEEEEE
jgi:hypothetical protein